MPACNQHTSRPCHPACLLTAVDTLLLSVVCTQDVLAASTAPLDLAPADAAAATTTAVPASTEVVAHVGVLDLPATADPIPDPALPEPAAQVQAVTSDVLTSTLLDLGSAGIKAAEPQQPAGGAVDDGVVSAAATTNVLDLTATGATSGKTPELIAVNVGHRWGGRGACWQPAPAPAPQTDLSCLASAASHNYGSPQYDVS